MVGPSYGTEDDSSCVHTAAVAPCVVAKAPQPTYIDDDSSHVCGAARTSAVTETLHQDLSMPH